MTKTTIELLREAREWLSVEEHWCACDRWSKDGNANCAIGAIERASGEAAAMPAWIGTGVPTAIDALARALRPDGNNGILAVAFFNDTRGWSKVLEMFDLAIKLEQEKMDRQAKELVESSVGEMVNA